MSVLETISSVITPPLEHMGYEVVRIKWIGGGGEYRTLQIMIEPASGADTKVEDCEAASNAISAILDVEDIIKDAYSLEVSSPGIDRPLTRLKDFENWKGFEAKLEINEVIDGRRRFKGKVVGVNGEIVQFNQPDASKVYDIPFAAITDAKLVLTDELIDFVTANKK